jgi:hypothetical protein
MPFAARGSGLGACALSSPLCWPAPPVLTFRALARLNAPQDTLLQINRAKDRADLRKPLKVGPRRFASAAGVRPRRLPLGPAGPRTVSMGVALTRPIPPSNLEPAPQVQFIGEEGVDEGGVQKEFFQLLVRGPCLWATLRASARQSKQPRASSVLLAPLKLPPASLTLPPPIHPHPPPPTPHPPSPIPHPPPPNPQPPSPRSARPSTPSLACLPTTRPAASTGSAPAGSTWTWSSS